jgi:uncharacterized protein
VKHKDRADAGEKAHTGPSLDAPSSSPTPWFSIVFLLVFTLLPSALLPNVTINNVPKVYLPEGSPAVVIDDKLRQIFPSDQGMVLLFEGDGLFSDSVLSRLGALTESLATHPDIDKAISVTSQDHIQGDDAGFVIEPLIDIEGISALSEEQRKSRVLSDRFARQTLVALDGSALAVVVIPTGLDDSFARMALQDDVHALIRQHDLTDYWTAEAGQITTDVEQMRENIQQNLRFIPLVVIIGLSMIWLLFRRVMAVVVATAVLATVVSSTLSLFVLFETPFNLISAILPPLLAALTIAALVHFFNALNNAAKRGKDGADRVAFALEQVRQPALYNALTTMAGFASLGLSDIPPIRSLGLVTAFGVGFIYLVVYHVIPPLFACFDRSRWASKTGRTGLIDRSVRVLFHFGIRRPLATLAIAGVAIAVSVPLVNNIVVETNLLEFFAEGHKTRIATEHIQEKLSGTGSLDIVVSSAQPGGLATPQSLLLLRNFQRWADAQPEVDKSRSFADFVEEMHWGFHAQQAAFRTIPDDATLISQYLFIYDGTDLYDFVDEDFQIARISLSINVHGAADINRFMASLRNYIEANTSEGVEWEIAGISRMFADQVDLLIDGQVKSMAGAVAIIFLLMLIQWRSLKDSVICMIPNLAPLLLIFVLMGAFGIWLDVATAMIASVAVGIAIDDTIHVYHGFIHRVRQGVSPTLAMARTYQQAGRAMTITTCILCTQFLLLATSSFVPVQNFGLLTSIGLMAALVFDLLLLPAILILVYPPASRRIISGGGNSLPKADTL